MFELCGKPSKFSTKSCLFIFCIFCLIEEKLIHQLPELDKFTSASSIFRSRNFICAPDRTCLIEKQIETTIFVLYYLSSLLPK